MSLDNLDPELAPSLEGFLATGPALDLENLLTTRETAATMMRELGDPTSDRVTIEDATAPGPEGSPEVRVRMYRPRESATVRPGIFWIHGGGMVIGAPEMDDGRVSQFVDPLGCVVASVDYRLAPEHPDPAPVEDCYAGLLWFVEHAAELGVDAERIAIAGASAGGGLAAGTALLARDRGGPSLRFQMLMCPMIDDREVTPSSRQYETGVIWSGRENRMGWHALLGDRVAGEGVSQYAAPARATDLAGLPPSFVDVGEVEVFRDECIDYACRLLGAGIPTELHVYPGAYHGFDGFAPESALAKQATANRLEALRRALLR
jgi:acetyl esterase/lipase